MTSPSRPIQAVTVYCSSSKRVNEVYLETATQLGKAIALAGWTLVYGGNNIGCMGRLADGARAAGGPVIGITPQLLVDKGIADPHCDELVVTPGMRQRKELLEQRADAFIAFPGGIGTFEELFEIMVARHLGYHAKPIVLLNVAGYYQPLLDMMAHGIDEHFIRGRQDDLYHVAPTVEDAIAHLKRHRADRPPLSPTPEKAAE